MAIYGGSHYRLDHQCCHSMKLSWNSSGGPCFKKHPSSRSGQENMAFITTANLFPEYATHPGLPLQILAGKMLNSYLWSSAKTLIKGNSFTDIVKWDSTICKNKIKHLILLFVLINRTHFREKVCKSDSTTIFMALGVCLTILRNKARQG